MSESTKNAAAQRASALHSMAWIENRLNELLIKAWPSYVLVFVLQLKILWNIWSLRDLTNGDTSSYFSMAYLWYERFTDNIVWSPLYTAFYGTVFMLTKDVYVATTLHRIIIVIAATLGVLAVMRKLLPPALALLIAAWWAILPINFDTLSEIHLFALLPVLAAWLIAGSRDTPLGRGTALAILVAATILVRYELIVASIVFALICLAREATNARRANWAESARWRSRLASYGAPLLSAITICAVFYWRSDIQYPATSGALASKHTHNICQAFAFGYSQRHPESTLNPWLECQQLMGSIFGQLQPDLLQMIESNPRAILEHALWNISLVPNGLQVALFNAMSGTVNPDYPPVDRSGVAAVLGLAVLLVAACGWVVMMRERDHWWPAWFRERRGAWLILLSVLTVSIPVILTQRPRPSYLFATTLVLMAVTGSAIHVLTYRCSVALKILAVTGMLALLATIPPYYVRHPSDRPLYAALERLEPYAAFMKQNSKKAILGAGELGGYLRLRRIAVDYSALSSWPRQQGLDRFLDAHGIDTIYVEPALLNELKSAPQALKLLFQPESVGWRRLGPESNGDPAWLLLHRRAEASGVSTSPGTAAW